MIDEKKLQQFLGKMIVDFGAAISVPLVRIGMARAKRGLRLSDLRSGQPTIRVTAGTSDGIRE